MKLKVSLLVFLGVLCSVGAQTKKWTLQECVAYAVENNLTIEQFELDIENAKIDKSDAIGNFLPSLNGGATVSERSGLVTNPQTNIIEPGQIFSTSGSINSGLRLFDGLRNIHQLNRAKINAVANQYRLDDLKDDIRLQVAQAYLQIISNKEALKVSNAQYAVTEQDLKRTKELVESGVVPRGDLLEIEATAASQEQQITPDPVDPINNPPVAFRADFVDQLWQNDGISYGFQMNVPVFRIGKCDKPSPC